jgi:TPR repeat protein
MRRSFSFLWALLLSVFLFGCAKEHEVAPKQVNPRLAKSGKKLVKESEAAIAPDSSKSLDAKPKADNNVSRKDGGKSDGLEAGVVSEPAAQAIPTKAEIQQLIRQAQAGDANAQVELGNIFFGGRGVPANKKAAEFWWRKALASRHPSAIQNLQMLYTKPEEGMSFFGTASKGNRLVFVIDKSSSMKARTGKENRLDKAKRELKRTLQALSPNMEFFIYFYDGVELPMPGGKLLKATPENISKASKWIDTVGCNGGTQPMTALRGAFNLKAQTIWLLTDGVFSGSNVANGVRTANAKLRARINTVAFIERSGEKALKQIAAESGGTYRFVRD